MQHTDSLIELLESAPVRARSGMRRFLLVVLGLAAAAYILAHAPASLLGTALMDVRMVQRQQKWTASSPVVEPRAPAALATATLPSTLETSIAGGFVLEHGSVQQLDANGAIQNDASLTKVQPEFEAAVATALEEWKKLPDAVPGLTLISVYLRGSIPRGLALPGLSDVDTIGFATISTDLPKTDVYKQNFPAMTAWKAEASMRDVRLRVACPACTGLEMKLILVPEDSGPGRWLSGKDTRTLTPAQEEELDLFRLTSHAVSLYGDDLTTRLAPPVLRPRLAVALQADLAKAESMVDTCEIDVETDCDSEAMRIARWAGKRTLRAGMELAAPELGYYSRDLLPCHRAIEKTLGEAAAAKSLEVLQLTCMPDEQVKKRGVSNVIHELLEACEKLRELYPSPR